MNNMTTFQGDRHQLVTSVSDRESCRRTMTRSSPHGFERGALDWLQLAGQRRA
jgi:hypothetical protein